MSGRAPRPTTEVERLAPYRVPAAGRRGLLRLDFNENLLGPSPRVLERLRSLDAEDLSLYPDESAARAAVTRRFALTEGLDLVLTSGVDEGIRLMCDCFGRPGEEVVILEPGYPMYRFYATLSGARLTAVEYPPDLSFPEQALRLAMDRGARLVLLGDPNNPTGTPVPEGLIEALADSHPETVVLVDEAYGEFAGRTSIPALAARPNLVVARTFSKAYGLAGLRAGVLLGRRETLAWVARMRSPYSVNAVALLALPAALEDEEHVARSVAAATAARARLAAGLCALGVVVFPSAANFLIARFGAGAPALGEALRRRGVLVRDRSDHPLLRGTLRIGVGTEEQADIALRAIAAALGDPEQGRAR
ncbi:MAG TPA: histidinol-phosphate transaminase [Candidatus Polarisedimenticolia bacterium]|nr:histidinol-phosphate transaminase [Candidatus Polarisedimenticolia bacterium]